MKFSVSILTLILFLLFNISDSHAQEKNAELEKLKAQLKQIGESDSFEIDIDGDKESSGTITIRVVRDVPGKPILKNNTVIGTTKTKKKEIKLPTIDLSKISVSDEVINEKLKLDAPTTVAKCGEINGVSLIQIGVSRDYLVLNDYIYKSDEFLKPSEQYSITVFKDYKYDRASIPRFLWGIIDKDSLGNVAPLIHDLLYEYGGRLPSNQVSPNRTFDREEADKMFLRIMERCGVKKVLRELAYQAVKNFGKPAWQERKRR